MTKPEPIIRGYQDHATITVRFTAPGFHHWPEAAEVLPERRYLADKHRHLFYVEATVSVGHHDREVEFHDLLDRCRNEWEMLGANDAAGIGMNLGRQSCEDIAAHYIRALHQWYPGRTYRVSVWEDNETGATVEATPVGKEFMPLVA